ncbi:hypothetical protein ACIQWR_21720 [Streptomyces sp. NPDC098789]
MTALRRTLTALVLTVLVAMGSAGTSYACDGTPSTGAGDFYCQTA